MNLDYAHRACTVWEERLLCEGGTKENGCSQRSNVGKRIHHSKRKLTEEGRDRAKVIAKELDIDEDLLK